ncbi:hypothetical protein D018_0049B, partial [Vibrio parahaemolyticus VP2007-007]
KVFHHHFASTYADGINSGIVFLRNLSRFDWI